MSDTVYTISRFILEHQPPQARGEFTNLLYDIALAAKLIAQKTTRVGLVDILGDAGEVNVQGESQKKLDVYADDIMFRLPDQPAYYSVNSARYPYWSEGARRYLDWLEREQDEAARLSSRYIGSLVADFHRKLLKGGVFCYPGETGRPDGKLRLLYEAAPLAFLVEQAGDCASNGSQAILDLKPAHLHQRVPLYIGNQILVEKAEELIRQFG